MDCFCFDYVVLCKYLVVIFYLLVEFFDEDLFVILVWCGCEWEDLLVNLVVVCVDGVVLVVDYVE